MGRPLGALAYFLGTALISGWVGLKTGLDALVVWPLVAFTGAALIYAGLALARRQ